MKPKAGKTNMYASGCLRNQGKCWNNNKSPPLKGSENERLKCRSEIIIVITPADTGRLIINNTDVKSNVRQYNGKKRQEWTIDILLAFSIVIIELMDPNKLLNPTMCKEKNIKSTVESS